MNFLGGCWKILILFVSWVVLSFFNHFGLLKAFCNWCGSLCIVVDVMDHCGLVRVSTCLSKYPVKLNWSMFLFKFIFWSWKHFFNWSIEWNCHTCHYLKIIMWAVRPFNCWNHNKIACNKCILHQKARGELIYSFQNRSQNMNG